MGPEVGQGREGQGPGGGRQGGAEELGAGQEERPPLQGQGGGVGGGAEHGEGGVRGGGPGRGGGVGPQELGLEHGLHGLTLEVGEAGGVTEALGEGVAVDLQLRDLGEGMEEWGSLEWLQWSPSSI